MLCGTAVKGRIVKCPSCGRKLTRAEQLWTATHGGKQCPYCRAGGQLGARRVREHLHSSGVKKGSRRRRSDRRLTP